MVAVTTSLILLAAQSGVVSPESRILVVSGSDTAAYAVGYTLRFTVGTPVQLLTRLAAPDGTPLTVKWHNTSGGLLAWERRNGFFGEGVVTATRNGVGSFMAHWGDTENTSIDVMFRATGGPAAPAASADVFDDAARAEVIDSLIATLDRAYVYPDVAARIASELRAQRSRGAYRDAGDAKAFAALLTEHAQAVSHDKHLRLGSGPAPGGPRRPPVFPKSPFGRTERLAGDVAYIEIATLAPGAGSVRDTVRRVMDAAADARALILDIRQNGGGRPDLVALICSYLFGDEPVQLNSIYWRDRDTTVTFFTDPHVEGRKFGATKPVFVLTSGRTFSAAEEFAYDLQARKRARIVGDTTGGGAHPGGGHGLPHGMLVFVPTGRAINPVTGTDWEGTGVVPDVAVPADQALETALELARKG